MIPVTKFAVEASNAALRVSLIVLIGQFFVPIANAIETVKVGSGVDTGIRNYQVREELVHLSRNQYTVAPRIIITRQDFREY